LRLRRKTRGKRKKERWRRVEGGGKLDGSFPVVNSPEGEERGRKTFSRATKVAA